MASASSGAMPLVASLAVGGGPAGDLGRIRLALGGEDLAEGDPEGRAEAAEASILVSEARPRRPPPASTPCTPAWPLSSFGSGRHRRGRSSPRHRSWCTPQLVGPRSTHAHQLWVHSPQQSQGRAPRLRPSRCAAAVTTAYAARSSQQACRSARVTAR